MLNFLYSNDARPTSESSICKSIYLDINISVKEIFILNEFNKTLVEKLSMGFNDSFRLVWNFAQSWINKLINLQTTHVKY